MANVTRRQMERYPNYLKLLILLKNNGVQTVSSSVISKVMKCSEEQVRKDLQAISRTYGKPGVGRNIDETIHDLQDFLGYNKTNDTVLVGVGRLGEAFLNYGGFRNYGFNIVAGFDMDPEKIGTEINGIPVYDFTEVEDRLKELNARIAILTIPTNVAQNAVDTLVKAGIRGFLNFAPVHLDVEDGVVIENVDIAASLAMVSHRLDQKEGND